MAVIASLRTKTRPSVDGAVYIPPGAGSSLEAFRKWYRSDDFPEEGRICYLDGELFIDMGHERISSHVFLKTAIAKALDDLADELDLGRFIADGVRFVNEKGNFSAEPDGCYFNWEAVDSGRIRLRQSNDGNDIVEIVGIPDMVLEVVSPSSVQKDKNLLRKLYHKARIPEYWLIDARRENFTFSILRNTQKGYIDLPVKGGWLQSAAFGREFQLKRSRDRMGVWRYKLLNRQLRTS